MLVLLTKSNETIDSCDNIIESCWCNGMSFFPKPICLFNRFVDNGLEYCGYFSIAFFYRRFFSGKLFFHSLNICLVALYLFRPIEIFKIFRSDSVNFQYLKRALVCSLYANYIFYSAL